MHKETTISTMLMLIVSEFEERGVERERKLQANVLKLSHAK